MKLDAIILDDEAQKELKDRLEEWKEKMFTTYDALYISNGKIKLGIDVIGSLEDSPEDLGRNLLSVLAKRQLVRL